VRDIVLCSKRMCSLICWIRDKGVLTDLCLTLYNRNYMHTPQWNYYFYSMVAFTKTGRITVSTIYKQNAEQIRRLWKLRESKQGLRG
jgi:hypothetical protein